MKNYKDFAKKYIGNSDIAALTVLFAAPGAGENPYSDLAAFVLEFNGDGDYYAYIVPKDVEIGSHYRLVKEINNCSWFKIFDDNKKTFESRPSPAENTVKIWRAGDYGCIIQFC